MLEDCLIESRSSARTRKPLTLVVSIITHGSLAAALILVPLFQEQLLPHVGIFEPLRPPEVHARVVDLAPAARQSAPAPLAPAATALYVPIAIPNDIIRYVDVPIGNSEGFPVAGPGGSNNGPNISGLIGLDLNPRVATPPPAPPAPPPAPPKAPEPAPAPTTPVPRGGDVTLSNLVHQVLPVYPMLAQKARVQGIVVLEAVITREGSIDPARIRVISGHVLLNDAALDAVKQWRYKPTLLNKKPVEILTTISVNFSFN